MDILKTYVDLFNSQDKEIYKTDIPNNMAYDWMKNEIPMLECPDKIIEKTYYYRWWTYRKHIKSTREGIMITEFLPDVSWSGKYNTINAPVGHHLAEGRWLKNSDKYLNDYIKLFLKCNEDSYKYSTWLVSAIKDFYNINNFDITEKFIINLCSYYENWEKTHMTSCGLFWSYDDRDAMEYSISGTKNLKPTKGIRPTLNSYMYADALAIARFAKIADLTEIAEKYTQKAENIKKLMDQYLWRDGFYKAIHPENEDFPRIEEYDTSDTPKELIGYIPWCFEMPEAGKEKVFDLLLNKNAFYTDFGLTTVEQTDRRFMYKVEHECLWNGYVWPFATSQVLSALKYIMFDYGDKEKYAPMYIKLLHQYAEQHTRITEDKAEIMWIDEVKHPYKNEWTSRMALENWGWPEDKGGFERGKDYNHSTFCDLVISGLTGIRKKDGKLKFEPILPKAWSYFKLDGIYVDGSRYCIAYDKDGDHYGNGKGFIITKDGQKLNEKVISV